MRPRRCASVAAVLAFGLALAGCNDEAASQPASPPALVSAAQPVGATGSFDFFVLALSWSPSYCAAKGADANRFQCAADRDLGFIVHGLWPQFEKGYPEFCAAREPDRVPNDLADSVKDIIPSRGLVGHQWRKHGSCTGLSQRDYLRTTRRAYERIAIPAALRDGERSQRLDATAVEAAFVAANAGLTEDGIAVSCDDGRVDEVRICLTQELDFRPCPELDRRGCRAAGLLLPAAP